MRTMAVCVMELAAFGYVLCTGLPVPEQLVDASACARGAADGLRDEEDAAAELEDDRALSLLLKSAAVLLKSRPGVRGTRAAPPPPPAGAPAAAPAPGGSEAAASGNADGQPEEGEGGPQWLLTLSRFQWEDEPSKTSTESPAMRRLVLPLLVFLTALILAALGIRIVAAVEDHECTGAWSGRSIQAATAAPDPRTRTPK
uniref:Uncharacterized protein n=2 Tax=Alexandrium monilatum TaxID=311494 RepID=A0A7S4SSG7_9DINO